MARYHRSRFLKIRDDSWGRQLPQLSSLYAFIEKINSLKSGTFLIGRNRIWHGGIHLSEKGGWHPSGAVRAIADGEIVAYRLATNRPRRPAAPRRASQGKT